MSLPSHRRTLFLVVALFVFPWLAPPLARAQGDVAPPVAPAPRVARPSALMTEIRALLAGERQALATLNARFQRASSLAEALSIQREIEQLKDGTEIALLRVQAKHARLAGRLDVARRIEEEVRILETPPPSPTIAVSRPRPSAADAITTDRDPR